MIGEREAVDKLAAVVPANVRQVCATLTDGGHEAVTVGGAVRDALLGREPGDWDVATSARPEQVLAMFPRCIPTGLQHGTVTIVTGRGEASHVEVTTFRGEGAYSDGRRPDEVHFGVPLVDDLARRDLVVNAMAYDPARRVLHDPFGGLADLQARRLRAVGPSPDPFANAVGRFTEDGLRVMRAVRFAAVLEFDLDPQTERGIGQPSVLASLAKVSRERVSDELRKLLAAPSPSRGLVPAVATGIVASILPAVAAALGDADLGAWARVVDAASAESRLAALLSPLASAAPGLDVATQRRVEELLRALKFSVAEATAASRLVALARCTAADAPALRRALRDGGRALGGAAVSLWRALGNGALADRAADILDRRDPIAAAELAVAGKDVIDQLAIPAGPRVGQLLKALFERVLDDPALNTREALLALAQTLP
jgi:tRNA nucleotidyltransferase (CCA-adding enzyme)